MSWEMRQALDLIDRLVQENGRLRYDILLQHQHSAELLRDLDFLVDQHARRASMTDKEVWALVEEWRQERA